MQIRNDDKQETEETRIEENNGLSDIVLGLDGGGPALQGRKHTASSKVG